MLASPIAEEPPTAWRVVWALTVTLAAAAVELVAAHSGASLFLTADAIHLVAHTAVYAILLVPRSSRRGRREDLATIAILAVIALIGLSILGESLRALFGRQGAPPLPGLMLVSLAGLAANLVSAYLFLVPAGRNWSFGAALAHEFSDAALTLAALIGALAIHEWGVRWIDPLLSLAIGVWLTKWSLGLLYRRAVRGPAAWRLVAGRSG